MINSQCIEVAEKGCQVCGNPVRTKRNKFCSQSCMGKAWTKPKRKAQCFVCGRCFITRIRPDRFQRYCSMICKSYADRKHKAMVLNGVNYHFDKKHGYYFAQGHTPSSYHAALWVHNNGPLPNGYVVHHRDENVSNNSIGNLEAVTKTEHSRLHNTGRKLSDKLTHHKGRFINKAHLAALEAVRENK